MPSASAASVASRWAVSPSRTATTSTRGSSTTSTPVGREPFDAEVAGHRLPRSWFRAASAVSRIGRASGATWPSVWSAWPWARVIQPAPRRPMPIASPNDALRAVRPGWAAAGAAASRIRSGSARTARIGRRVRSMSSSDWTKIGCRMSQMHQRRVEQRPRLREVRQVVGDVATGRRLRPRESTAEALAVLEDRERRGGLGVPQLARRRPRPGAACPSASRKTVGSTSPRPSCGRFEADPVVVVASTSGRAGRTAA